MKDKQVVLTPFHTMMSGFERAILVYHWGVVGQYLGNSCWRIGGKFEEDPDLVSTPIQHLISGFFQEPSLKWRSSVSGGSVRARESLMWLLVA